jgi:hypothetical protein
MRMIVRPETVTCFPVGPMPAISPVCVPRAVHRVAAFPSAANWSSTVIAASGKPAR